MPQQYTGEALKTYERIHVLRSYHYNKLYISPDKIIYHINLHGFLHAYTAGKCKDYDGSKIYYIRDNLLTRDNLLRESLTTFYHSKEEAKAAWEAMQADAEANTAEERPQETATATGTTAGGESITTTETEPQRAAERPQADAEPHHPANDQEPQEAAKKTTSGQTNTRTDKTPQEATQRPKRGTHSPATYEAHKTATAPAGDQGTTAGDKDNTRSDTRPPRAQETNQEPGHAAGDHSGQAADHITGPTTGNTSGAAAEAITGRTTTPPQNPGHACENAPGRTERATPGQVHIAHTKSPPRAAQ